MKKIEKSELQSSVGQMVMDAVQNNEAVTGDRECGSGICGCIWCHLGWRGGLLEMVTWE